MRFLSTLQDYNNRLAQLRAGKSSKSKLLIAKFKSAESLDSWEVRQGTYFQDTTASKYDGGMDAKFEFTESERAEFSGTDSLFCEQGIVKVIFRYIFWYGGLIGFQMQVMFSPEEAMLSCRRSFHFH